MASRVYLRKGLKLNMPSIVFCETPSSTEWSIPKSFTPNLYIPLKPIDIESKIKACNYYPDVMRNHPHSRSEEYLKSLATIRGSECNNVYAEGYMLKYLVNN